MKYYKIGELADILKINTDTIRYYEKIGLIPKPKRQENKYRIYSEQYIEMIELIMLCKDNGFTLKEIDKMINILLSENENKEIMSLVDEKINEIDNKIRDLVILKGKLNDLFKDCDIEECSITHLFEEETI